MNDIGDILFFLSVLGCVAACVFLLAQYAFNSDERRIASRLSKGDRNDLGAGKPMSAVTGNKPQSLFKRLGTAAAKPFTPNNQQKVNTLRQRLSMAGIYDPAAIKSMIGFKFIFLAGGLIFGYVVGSAVGNMFLGLSLGGLIGYLAPQMWLKSKVSTNQKMLNEGLPDALDLMVICVEAGLTIDATMQRVGEELSLAHPAISREMGITHTETRLGVSRTDAFRNLAARTGNLALQSLVAMLIQADRFGTSIGTALRIQAESMRIKRQLAAEEVAAKASVKMSFPLVLFIFPATFIVLAGPTVIGLLESELFK